MLVRLLANLLRVLLFPLRWTQRQRVLPPGGFVHVTVDGAVKDVVPEQHFWNQWRPRAMSLAELGEMIDLVFDDPRARGLLVTLRSLRGGRATATSLRGALARVSSAGK
jgi:hypothetical protein